MRFPSLTADFRMALRRLRRQPALAAACIASLSIGLGASSTVFTFVNAVALRELPFARGASLVMVSLTSPAASDVHDPLSVPQFVALRDAKVFDELGGYDEAWTVTLGVGGALTAPERLSGRRISASLFSVLGVSPAVGRFFQPADDVYGGAPTIVLGHQLWRDRFASDRGIVGRSLIIDNLSTEVIGVAPEGFTLFGRSNDFYMPFRFSPNLLQGRAHWVYTVARRSDALTDAEIGARLQAAFASFQRRYPERDRDHRLAVRPLRRALFGSAYSALGFLQAAGALALLACGANVGVLLLARALDRQRETSIELALGQSRAGLVRQSVLEVMVLCVPAALCGLGLATLFSGTALRYAPSWLPRLQEAPVDATVVLFGLLVAVVTGLGVGIVPAIARARGSLAPALMSRGVAPSGSSLWRLGTLVAVELCLACVLIVLAGLLVTSFSRLRNYDDARALDHLTTFQVRLPLAAVTKEVAPEGGYSMRQYSASIADFFERACAELGLEPGLEAVAASDKPPLVRAPTLPFDVDGSEGPREANGQAVVDARLVTSKYFSTLGTLILTGRDFAEADRKDSAPVAIVNQAFARMYWPSQSAVSRSLRLATSAAQPPREVIGIAADMRPTAIDTVARPTVYMLQAQQPEIDQAQLAPIRTEMTFLVRSPLDRAALERTVRRALSRVSTVHPVYNVVPAADYRDAQLTDSRYYAALLSTFGAVAFVLALVGVHGVLARLAQQRAYDVAVRRALGATDRVVIKELALSAGGFLAAGLACGVVAAILVIGSARAAIPLAIADAPVVVLASVAALALGAVATGLPALLRCFRMSPRDVLGP